MWLQFAGSLEFGHPPGSNGWQPVGEVFLWRSRRKPGRIRVRPTAQAGRPLNPLDASASAAARLGADLRAQRLECGLTLEALAAKIGYSPQHVSSAELAKSSVSGPFVAACDRALGAGGKLVGLMGPVVQERPRGATREASRVVVCR
jgi:hypothetical protein